MIGSAVIEPTDTLHDVVLHKRGRHQLQLVQREYDFTVRVIDIELNRCVREVPCGRSERLMGLQRHADPAESHPAAMEAAR